MNKLGIFLFVFLLFTSTTGCANEQGPWHGKVINAETKQPIEGAVVVAVWHKSSFGGGAGPVESFYDVKETLTDKDGKFFIPVYKYRNIPFVREIRDPEFTIFKPGYGSFPHYQVSPLNTPRDLFLNKVFEGVVELPKLTDNKKRIESLTAVTGLTGAPLEKIPELDKLIGIERRNLGY